MPGNDERGRAVRLGMYDSIRTQVIALAAACAIVAFIFVAALWVAL